MPVSLVSRLGLLIVAASVAAGCGTAPTSSYLADTSRFGTDPKLEGALVYRHPSRLPRDFRKVWLDAMEVQFANASDAKETDAAAMKEFLAFWRSETEAHLKMSHELASGPGEGTLRVRMALTRVLPAKPGQMFTPITTPTRLDLASATLEAEAVDSVTGERILAIIDKSAASRPAGTDRLDHAKKLIKAWMDRLFTLRGGA